MIRNSLSAAGLLLAAGVVSALAIASTDAMAAERASTVRHGPATNDPNPVVTPCGACYSMRDRRLYVSLDAIGSAKAISLELDLLRDGKSAYGEQLAPYRVANGYVEYLVPQAPTEDVGGGRIHWVTSQGRFRTMTVIVAAGGEAE
ncbi:hypothetical protein WMF26_16375 [Sorangium sp. So ce185]|uniref:hypothetical protein n=1 Tax=Sorangium sp. So ce185 TaxID=3133287 RepID=UPI003F62DFCB